MRINRVSSVAMAIMLASGGNSPSLESPQVDSVDNGGMPSTFKLRTAPMVATNSAKYSVPGLAGSRYYRGGKNRPSARMPSQQKMRRWARSRARSQSGKLK